MDNMLQTPELDNVCFLNYDEAAKFCPHEYESLTQDELDDFVREMRHLQRSDEIAALKSWWAQFKNTNRLASSASPIPSPAPTRTPAVTFAYNGQENLPAPGNDGLPLAAVNSPPTTRSQDLFFQIASLIMSFSSTGATYGSGSDRDDDDFPDSDHSSVEPPSPPASATGLPPFLKRRSRTMTTLNVQQAKARAAEAKMMRQLTREMEKWKLAAQKKEEELKALRERTKGAGMGESEARQWKHLAEQRQRDIQFYRSLLEKSTVLVEDEK